MNIKYPNNIIVVVSIVAVLLGGTILLSGYAVSKPADTTAPTKQGCCPAMAQTAACQQMASMQAEAKACDMTPCTEKAADDCCDDPCPVPCPKPCCAEDAPKSCCGLDETAAQ